MHLVVCVSLFFSIFHRLFCSWVCAYSTCPFVCVSDFFFFWVHMFKILDVHVLFGVSVSFSLFCVFLNDPRILCGFIIFTVLYTFVYQANVAAAQKLHSHFQLNPVQQLDKRQSGLSTCPQRETGLSSGRKSGSGMWVLPSRKGHLSHELHNNQLGLIMSDSFPFRIWNFCVTHKSGRWKQSSIKISGD